MEVTTHKIVIEGIYKKKSTVCSSLQTKSNLVFSVHCCSRGRQAPFHALCRFPFQTSCDTKLVILSQNSIYHHQWRCMYQWTLWHLKALLSPSSLSMLIERYHRTHCEHEMMWQLTANRTLWPTTKPSSSDYMRLHWIEHSYQSLCWLNLIARWHLSSNWP